MDNTILAAPIALVESPRRPAERASIAPPPELCLWSAAPDALTIEPTYHADDFADPERIADAQALAGNLADRWGEWERDFLAEDARVRAEAAQRDAFLRVVSNARRQRQLDAERVRRVYSAPCDRTPPKPVAVKSAATSPSIPILACPAASQQCA